MYFCRFFASLSAFGQCVKKSPEFSSPLQSRRKAAPSELYIYIYIIVLYLTFVSDNCSPKYVHKMSDESKNIPKRGETVNTGTKPKTRLDQPKRLKDHRLGRIEARHYHLIIKDIFTYRTLLTKDDVLVLDGLVLVPNQQHLQ